MSHYDQFVSMLDSVRQVSPMVFQAQEYPFNSESAYRVVEMESGAGKIMFGFHKDTGELVDVMGPCRHSPVMVEPSGSSAGTSSPPQNEFPRKFPR